MNRVVALCALLLAATQVLADKPLLPVQPAAGQATERRALDVLELQGMPDSWGTVGQVPVVNAGADGFAFADQTGEGGGISDAPSDGSPYVRLDAAWTLLSGAETDPVYSLAPAAGITADDISHWGSSYGWGDHSLVGYLTSESDPVFLAEDTLSELNTRIGVTLLQASDVDDTPVNGATTVPVSSNWAYDHAANLLAHVLNEEDLVVSGSDINLQSNTSYAVYGSGATSSVVLHVPAGTAGDRIRLTYITTSETYPLYVGGVTGSVLINGDDQPWLGSSTQFQGLELYCQLTGAWIARYQTPVPATVDEMADGTITDLRLMTPAGVAAAIAALETPGTDDQTAAEVPVSASPVHYTAATPDAEAHFIGIDTAIGGLGGGHDAVTLVGTPDYLTISEQEITLGLIDLATDVTGDLPWSSIGSTPTTLAGYGITDADVAAADITDATADGIALITSANANAFTDADEAKLDAIEAGADVTDEANVTDALDGASLTDVGTPASTDRILLQDASDSGILKTADFSEFGGGGSFAWTVETAAPTSGDVTPDAGDWVRVSLASATADPGFVLPSCTVGDGPIAVEITATSASHELVIAGDTGVSVGGASAGAEWSRVWIKEAGDQGESARFACVAADTWVVTYDGRIQQVATMYRSTSNQSGVAQGTWTKVLLNAVGVDNAEIADSGNSKIVPRRGGIFTAYVQAFCSDMSDRSSIAVAVYEDSTPLWQTPTVGVSKASPGNAAAGGANKFDFTAGLDVEMWVYQNPGTSSVLAGETLTLFSIVEAL